jgi:hypothetical protein
MGTASPWRGGCSDTVAACTQANRSCSRRQARTRDGGGGLPCIPSLPSYSPPCGPSPAQLQHPAARGRMPRQRPGVHCKVHPPPPTCQISPERLGTQDEGCGRGRSKSTGRAVGKIVCSWRRAVGVGIRARGDLSRKLEEQSGLYPTPRREIAMIRGCGKAWEIGWMASGSVWGARTERMTPGDGTPASC